MKYPVLLREDSPNRYTATALALPDCSAVGATEEEALTKVKEQLARRTQDVKVVEVDVPLSAAKDNPWLELFGIWKDDPEFVDELMAEVEAYRKSVDSE